MKIHEYQAKQIFARYRIPVPRGKVAGTPEEAGRIHDELDSPLAVVKAQVHAGGRGKGGGVKLAKSREATEKAAREILSKPLVTPQTGPEGRKVHRVLVEEGIDLDREFYLGMTIDRAKEAPVVMASSEGGVEIEEVAKRFPQKIHKVHLSSMDGLAPFEARSLFFALGLDRERLAPFTDLVTAVARAFLDLDASLVEVNPLVTRKSGGVLALDAKMNFDDNALFRHPEILELRDVAEEDPAETLASKHDLSYIRLDGSIGCMVNGAGLAMSTMDLIQLHGGRPANFLDVGGTATTDRVTQALKIILSDANVRAILVNIFGGIVKCDVVAEGILAAAKEVRLSLPLVVRLEGTNVERARELLGKSGLAITTAGGLTEAASKIVALATGRR